MPATCATGAVSVRTATSCPATPECPGHARITPSHPTIAKLRDGGRDTSLPTIFGRDSTAPSVTSGGEGFSPRGFRCAGRAVHHREESNDGTHETNPPELQRRRVGPEPGPGLPRSEDWPDPDQQAGPNTGGTPWTLLDHSSQVRSSLTATVSLSITVPCRSLRSHPVPCTIDRKWCNGKSYMKSGDPP